MSGDPAIVFHRLFGRRERFPLRFHNSDPFTGPPEAWKGLSDQEPCVGREWSTLFTSG